MNYKPLVCMQTESNAYQRTSTMIPAGVLWHSTGAANPKLKRYIQPSDIKPPEDTYNKEQWLEILGENIYHNDYNHDTTLTTGFNALIGKLADGTVATIQTMPWNYKPWGCGSGPKGSCNTKFIQFEICEDNLNDPNYFNQVYQEGVKLTAYLCELFKFDPFGTTTINGVTVPTILCHADANALGLGSAHIDVLHWFKKYNKTMDDVRKDVANLMGKNSIETKTYEVFTKINKYLSAANAKDQVNPKGTFQPGIYYLYNKYQGGYQGMFNLTTDPTGMQSGSWINPSENIAPVVPKELYYVRKDWSDTATEAGVFETIEEAKKCCQEKGSEYKVFNKLGIKIYSYVEPEETETDETFVFRFLRKFIEALIAFFKQL